MQSTADNTKENPPDIVDESFERVTCKDSYRVVFANLSQDLPVMISSPTKANLSDPSQALSIHIEVETK